MKKLKVFFKPNSFGVAITFYDWGFDGVFLFFYFCYSNSNVGHFGDMEDL